jgi:hypothetical protein
MAAGKALFQRYHSNQAFASEIRYLRLREECNSGESADLESGQRLLLTNRLSAEHQHWRENLKRGQSCLKAATSYMYWAAVIVVIFSVIDLFWNVKTQGKGPSESQFEFQKDSVLG